MRRARNGREAKMNDMKKLFEALENFDAAYIKVGSGNRYIIVCTKEFSDWVDNNWDDEDDVE